MSKTKVTVGAGAGAALGALAMFMAVPTIEKWEGLENRTYRDVAGVLTICAGHTGPDVRIGQYKTDEECAQLTAQDARKASQGVLRTSPHLIFHPMQLAAAISFSYNVGTGTYASSSVASNFNSGNFTRACERMLLYNKINCSTGCQVSRGLANRREEEYNICMSTLTKDRYLTDVTIVDDSGDSEE